MNTFAAVELH